MWRLLLSRAGPARAARLALLRPNSGISSIKIITSSSIRSAHPPRVCFFSSSSSSSSTSSSSSSSPSSSMKKHGAAFSGMPPNQQKIMQIMKALMASTTIPATEKHIGLAKLMREAYALGRHVDVTVLYRELVRLKEQERKEVQLEGGQIKPILPVEMAMCLSVAVMGGELLSMEQAIKSFFDSYPHNKETGACLIVEELGQKWWEPIAAELGKGREKGEEWEALWALYQEAKKRKILEGLPREGEEGDGEDGIHLRAHVLKVLSQAAAAAKDEHPQCLPFMSSPGCQTRDDLIFTLASPLAPKTLLQLEMMRQEDRNYQEHKYTPQDFHDAIAFLSAGGLVDEGVGLLRRLTEQGQTPLPETYDQLIPRLYWQNRKRNALCLFHEMRERTGTGNQQQIDEVMNREAESEEEEDKTIGYGAVSIYARAQAIDFDEESGSLQVLKRLTLLTETFGLRPRMTSYSYVLRGLADGRHGPEAYQLLQQIKKRGVSPDGWCYSEAIKACGRTGNMHPQTIELSREMPAKDKTFWSYCFALEALAAAGHCQEALDLFKELKLNGIAADAPCYNAMMKAHRSVGQLEEALALLRQMPRDGVQPDAITYTIAIDVCARRGDADLAIKLLREMEEGPDRIAPNVISYGSAINACTKALQGERALALFREMQEKGLRPNIVIYTLTIDALHRSTDNDTALVEIYEEMKAAGFKPVAATLVAAINAYDRMGGMPDKIVQMGREFIAADVGLPSRHTLKILLSAAIQAGKYQDGMHFFNKALIQEPGRSLTKLASTCAAEVGDLTTLRIYLEYAQEAGWRVEDWMFPMAFKAVARAKAEADEKKSKTGEVLGEKDAEAIEKLRALALMLQRDFFQPQLKFENVPSATADLRRRDGRVALGSRADGDPSPKKGTRHKKRM